MWIFHAGGTGKLAIQLNTLEVCNLNPKECGKNAVLWNIYGNEMWKDEKTPQVWTPHHYQGYGNYGLECGIVTQL